MITTRNGQGFFAAALRKKFVSTPTPREPGWHAYRNTLSQSLPELSMNTSLFLLHHLLFSSSFPIFISIFHLPPTHAFWAAYPAFAKADIRQRYVESQLSPPILLAKKYLVKVVCMPILPRHHHHHHQSSSSQSSSGLKPTSSEVFLSAISASINWTAARVCCMCVCVTVRERERSKS